MADLPCLEYERADAVPDSTAIFDREASLLVVNLDKPNDYSGEFVNSEMVCISLDSQMMIEDMEIKLSTSAIASHGQLALPGDAVPAAVRFRDCLDCAGTAESITADNGIGVVHVRLAGADEDGILHLRVASGIVLDVTPEDRLVGIWVDGVITR